MKLITEAVFVGVSLVAYALLVSKIMEKIFPNNQNDFKRMIIGIFVTGTTLHLVFEATRLNKYYCIHGNACQKI